MVQNKQSLTETENYGKRSLKRQNNLYIFKKRDLFFLQPSATVSCLSIYSVSPRGCQSEAVCMG